MDIDNDQSHKELTDDIKAIAEGLLQSIRISLVQITPEVESVIRNHSHNKQQIERLLDRLLDLCASDEALPLFKKLCRYYYFINPQATANYVRYYREMWDEESAEGGEER